MINSLRINTKMRLNLKNMLSALEKEVNIYQLKDDFVAYSCYAAGCTNACTGCTNCTSCDGCSGGCSGGFTYG